MPPVPALPALDPAALSQALPEAISFTLLRAIEALLSAVVADGMTGRHHRSNAELGRRARPISGPRCSAGSL